ncbi:ribose-5-phosphate isomerase RpiA [soil metagenome]
MNPKQRAAEAALDELRDGMTVGLGSGSTSECFIDALGAALKAKRLRGLRCVATSVNSETRATKLGIEVISLAEAKQIDVTIDGADEIDPALNLIKGLGGALLREKIVAQNSRRLVIIADESKRVAKLGTKSPLPVEVIQFGFESHESFLRTLGCEPSLRRRADGEPYVTDNHNYIYDCRFDGIDQPAALEMALRKRAGIVESGLFVGMAKLALVADGSGVQRIEAHSAPSKAT